MIAVQLYTFRGTLRDISQLPHVLGALRDIGYRAVEVAGLGSNASQRLAIALRKADMVACAAHIPHEQLVADLDGVAAACSDWGCGYVVVPALPKEYRSRDGYLRFAAEARILAERLRLFGLRLVYHNHSDELQRFGRQTGLDILFTETSADRSALSRTLTGFNMAAPIQLVGFAASVAGSPWCISKTWSRMMDTRLRLRSAREIWIGSKYSPPAATPAPSGWLLSKTRREIRCRVPQLATPTSQSSSPRSASCAEAIAARVVQPQDVTINGAIARDAAVMTPSRR